MNGPPPCGRLLSAGHYALWKTPGETALRTMVGWNIGIMFMFAVSGIIFYNTLSKGPNEKILGLPNRWFWALGYFIICVFVEVFLNIGGLLVWEYPFWNRSFAGIWLIIPGGHFWFYAAVILVLEIRTMPKGILAVPAPYSVPVLMNMIARAFLGWRY